MIKLQPFTPSKFDTFISWIDSEELLIQIAGTFFSFPLTVAQLQNYLNDERSFAFSIVEADTNKIIIGHAEIYKSDMDTCKLDKISIGDKSNRGKGAGVLIVKELLKFSFERLNAKVVELNVYDWNIAGIKIYEKAGFEMNCEKNFSTLVNGKTWTALNMYIDKQKWKNRK